MYLSLLKWCRVLAEVILTHFFLKCIYFSVFTNGKEQLCLVKVWAFKKSHLWSTSKSLPEIWRQFIPDSVYIIYIYQKIKVLFSVKSSISMGLTQITFHLFIKIKDVDHISSAVANRKPVLGNKCHSHVFHSVVFAERKHKSQKPLYVKNRQKVLSQEQVSVI